MDGPDDVRQFRFPHRGRDQFVGLFGAADPDHTRAMFGVLERLEALGHHVEPAAELSRVGAIDDFLPLWQSLIASAPLFRAKVQPTTRWLLDQAKAYTRAQLETLHDRTEALVDEVFGNADVFVSPTTPIPAPRIGAARDLAPEHAFRHAANLAGFTAPFNVSGQPACSLPAGFGPTGLPIGTLGNPKMRRSSVD